MDRIKRVLPHISIILSGMMVIFFVIDKLNAAMTLMSNDMTKALLFLLSIVTIIVSAMLISRQRKEG